jgi:hypothetical protein
VEFDFAMRKISLYEPSLLEDIIEKLYGIPEAADLRIDHLVGLVGVELDDKKVGCLDLSQGLVQSEIRVGKQREGDVVQVPEGIDFERRIPGAYSQQLHLVLQTGSSVDLLEELVDGGSFFLTVRTVHAEHFNDDQLRFELRDLEMAIGLGSQVRAFLVPMRNGQLEVGKRNTHQGRLPFCGPARHGCRPDDESPKGRDHSPYENECPAKVPMHGTSFLLLETDKSSRFIRLCGRAL